MAIAREPNAIGTAPLKGVEATPDPFDIDESQHPAVSLEQFLRVLRRYRWSIVVLAAIGAVVGLLNALSATPMYMSQARLLVKYNQPNIVAVNQFESAPMYWLFYKTQADIIKSRAIAERVVDKLIAKEAELLKADAGASRPQAPPTPPSALDALRETWRSIKRDWLPDWRAWLELGSGVRRAAPVEPIDERQRRINRISGGLNVSGGEESEVLVVRFESGDPSYAALVANTAAEAYIEFGLESRVSNVQQTTRWLGDRIEELRETLQASELALREFQAREGMVATQNREQIISSKLATLTAELIRSQTRRSDAEARYNQVQALAKDDPDYEALAAQLDSELVLDAYRDRKDASRRVVELSERYGRKHPKMVAANAELREADRRLKSELRKSVASVRKEYELARTQEKHLAEVIDKQQREMRAVSGKAFELDKLEKDVEANRRIYESFLERFKQADIAENYNVTNVRIIDPAQVPSTPYRPNKQHMVLMSLFGGLVIGVVLAFLRSQLDRTFKISEDIENILRLPVLGMVPRARKRPWRKGNVDSYVRDEPRTAFAEAVNDIRTAILFSRVDERPRVILVTSAVPGEGKTTLASNLALSFGQRGRTLLLEGDLRKGRLQKLLGESSHLKGITDVVSGDCELQDVVFRYPETEQVFVLTHGTPPPNPLELISSRRFAAALGQLKKGFEYIVIDGSPLLPVSDSVVLGDLADVVVLAVQSERTTHAVAREALKRLSAARIRPAGVVLQQVDFRRLRSYHGDHAGYGRYYTYRGYYGGSR